MEIMASSPTPAPFSADVDRLTLDLNSAFNPLHPGCQVSFQVTGVKDGYVVLSVALPEGMTRAYVALLESLGGLFRCLDIKSRSAVSQVKAYDLAERTAVSDRATAFSKKVVALFDDFIAKGNTVLDSTKLTNRALKAESHPWATYEVVAMVLRKAGKFRKKRG
jgi:hypothetical protein